MMLTVITLGMLLGCALGAPGISRTYKIYHSLGSGNFVERGVITLSTPDASKEKLKATVDHSNDCMSPKEIDDMVQDGKMYSIRVVDESGGGSAAMASVPGCDLRRANFREEISLTLGHTGDLVSVSYTPLVSPLAPSCRSLAALSSVDSSTELKFTTTMKYETATSVMSVPLVLPQTRPPPGLSFYSRKDGTAPGSKTGMPGVDQDKPQNKSFLMRYWYIILPLAIMSLTGGEEPPPQGGAAGQSSGAGPAAVAGAAAAGAASAGAGAAQRPRRGKRG
eukprot:CAMPEP_0113529738 /NCGR_PEP_ID=MMETSP0015_2-20120614/2556_1 /TAXON_ID=2838 /ORGANISM="Odontella" /LENGTH=278 /DNA_ID=CAMNT_0000428393 /DNA_START=148 /DNA_END=984 /DNA_ORIENTATION=- /assembly_acc=CAM_ASM_000160